MMKSVKYRVSVVEFTSQKTTVKGITAIGSYSNFSFEERGIRVWKAFGVGEGTCMLQFNYLFWGYIGITLSVCSPFRPSMYLVNATPPKPFNGF